MCGATCIEQRESYTSRLVAKANVATKIPFAKEG